MTHTASSTDRPLTTRAVYTTWWPLAASWLLMGLELPAVSAMMARMRDPTVSLAAYGGVVFPLALMIESPIIMLLAASTALSRDWASYRVVQRFMLTAGGLMTLVHFLIAYTPLFDVVVVGLIGPPEPVREPARIGLQIMIPWTMCIAFRRTQQGVLIRFGRSRAIGIGTATRLGANLVVLAIGWLIGTLPGIVVGTAAVAAGVISEALYAAWAVHPVLRDRLRPAPPVAVPLTRARFNHFYFPLMITPIFMFLAMPMTTGAMSRMPHALESLAVWPVLGGLAFTMRSLGFAYNEVVVAQLDAPRPVPALRRFAALLATGTSLVLLVAAATPLGDLWFGRISALPPGLVALGTAALWFAIPLPGLSAYQSLYQGALVHSHRTRGVTEAVIVLLVVTALVLVAGVAWGHVAGVYIGVAAMVIGGLAHVSWLRWRARGELRAVAVRDPAPPEATAGASA